MLRRHFDHRTENLSEPEFRQWISRVVATMVDVVALVAASLLICAFIFLQMQHDRDLRREVVDDRQFHTACLVLRYPPPYKSKLYHDLAELYPECRRINTSGQPGGSP